MPNDIISERSQIRKRIEVRDADGNLVLPSNVRWKVDCVTNRQAVLGWQTASAAISQVIEIPAGANVIIKDSNWFETKLLTIQVNWGTDQQLNAEYEWDVRNNKFYS